MLPELIPNPVRPMMLKIWIGPIEKQNKEMIERPIEHIVPHLAPMGGTAGSSREAVLNASDISESCMAISLEWPLLPSR